MANLDGLGLQNFRTFTRKENFEFAPITLITGTNNAGKSSIFKALQFLANNFKDGIVSETLEFKTMKHELGNLERIFNRVSMTRLKGSEISHSKSLYSRITDFHRNNDNHPNGLPIFEDDEDLVFAFPIKFGSSRGISADLEVRYEMNRLVPKNGSKIDVVISHKIKSIAIVKDGEYLHWSNIIGYREYYDESPDWEMKTSLDLKKIIQLILETPFVEIEEFEPNEITEEYFSIDLFSRIEKYKDVFLDSPFFKRKKDGYNNFTENFVKGKSLFSDYSELTEEQRLKLFAIEQKVVTDLLQGRDNNHAKVLECFKHSFVGIFGGIEKDIVSAELKEEITDEKQNNDEGKNIRDSLKRPMFQTTPNSELFTSLLRAIENDFLDIVQKKIDSLNKIYFLPTTRGRNREWFIDEQNSGDIQIVRDFSAMYLEHHQPIQNFVDFWIGKGEINELDENGRPKLKGFNIGKKLSVFRDENIGLTKIFLVNFDGTKTPLVDLGYGVSQLLPIIMKIAIIAQKQQRIYEYDWNSEGGYPEKQTIYYSASTLLIEEPEANLHPSLQSKMAELFIDAASRFNIQFLIETHSEYLIYKFQEYIGRKIVSPNDVKIYYFNHPNDVREGLKDKYINHVQIAKDGSIDYHKYFGQGFFDEQTNLKLILLNIQRNRFTEDYESITEELKKSSETLKEYDVKIEQLNREMSTITSGKSELEKQLNKITLEKEQKELVLGKLIKKQDDIIDQYTAKTDYLNYIAEIGKIIDINKIDNSKTLQYLSTGKYLLNNLDSNADFAPVIIQYGRAVEFEMIKWIVTFRSTINSTDINSWCNDTNYENKIIQVFTGLGLTPVDRDYNYEINPGNKINILNLRNYINSSSGKFVFGKLTQIFELFYDISPAKNATYNYKSVPLMVAFSNYLQSIWANYTKAECLFNTYRYILDLRNCAGHTYSNGVCASNIIDKKTADNYVANVEAIFSCL